MSKPKFSNEDLSRWKREINPAPILGSRMKLSRENSEYIGTCPPCFHDAIVGHPDKSPSFKVYKLDEGVWGFKCFGCGANGNVFQFVQKFDKVSFATAVETVLTEAGGIGWQDGEEQGQCPVATQDPPEVTTFTLAQYAPATQALEHAFEAQVWLAKRGISMETARKFYLGFVQSAEKITNTNAWCKDGWVLFPTFAIDHTTVTAVKYRSIVGKKAKIDGKENSGILRAPNTSTTLFNLQTVSPGDDVWLAEGEPDTVVLAQAGLVAVGYPMAGYKPTDDECELLSMAKRRFLAGDNDPAGVKAMADIQKRLRGATFVITWPNQRKDANDVLTNECGNDTEKFKTLVEDLKARAVQTETEPILRTGTEVKPQSIKWLWEGKIPLGKLTLFAGNPDNGKSLAVTSVAAICSRGDKFPECYFQQAPSDVLMLLGEDDLEDTAVPRLIAADAVMSRIHFLEAVRPVKLDDREVRLDMDIPAIERQLDVSPAIRLLIIDPISNYLGEVSMIAEQEVRSILIPLKRMAEKYNISVIIVMHLNKKADLDAISRVGGAMAFIGVARCSWLFTRNVQEAPEDGENGASTEKPPDTFSMLRIKNNLVSSNRSGMSYHVATRLVEVVGEPSISTPFVIWGNVIDGSADEALERGRGGRQSEPVTPRGVGRPNTKLQAAIAWLEDALQDGEPHNIKTLRKDAKDGANIALETLDGAYKAIHGKKPFKSGRFWFWQIEPMDEIGDEGETPQQSELLRVEGAE